MCPLPLFPLKAHSFKSSHMKRFGAVSFIRCTLAHRKATTTTQQQQPSSSTPENSNASASPAFLSLGYSITQMCTKGKTSGSGTISGGPVDPRLEPLPVELHTESDAVDAMKEIGARIGAGFESLHAWRKRHYTRQTVAESNTTNWVDRVAPSSSSSTSVANITQCDRDLVRWAVEEAFCVISPFVELRTPHPTYETTPSSKPSPPPTSTFYAKKAIPSGVILFSIPTELAVQTTTPTTTTPSTSTTLNGDGHTSKDHVAEFFRAAEELCMQLAVELPKEEKGSPHSRDVDDGLDVDDDSASTLTGYVQYLTSATAPPRNLPYLQAKDVFPLPSSVDRVKACIAALDGIPTSNVSKRQQVIEEALNDLQPNLPQQLWFDHHVNRKKQPVQLSIFRSILLSESITEQRRLIGNALDTGVLHRVANRTASATDIAFLRTLLARRKAAASSGVGSSPSSTITADGEDNIVPHTEEGASSSSTSSTTTSPPRASAALPSGESFVSVLSPEECDALLPPLPPVEQEEYEWLLSMVLSRRLGDTLCVPLLDKLQHYVDPKPTNTNTTTTTMAAGEEVGAASPAAYYSMATRASMTGVDIFENIIAGVEGVYLYEPYIHVYALRDISKGEMITLSYSDLDPNPKKKAGVGGMLLWKVLWGFVPAKKSPLSEAEIRQIGGFISGNRLHAAQRMFPMSK